MTERDDDLDIVLRPWMHQHAPDAPSDLVLRIYGEIETMSEQTQTHRWLSRFAAWPAGAWAASLAAVAILAVAGGLFLTNIGRLSVVGDQPTPTPVTSPSPVDPTAVADELITAWNSGDGQQAASLYTSYPWVESAIDATGIKGGLLSRAEVAAAVTTWHDNGSVMTRTADVLTQDAFAAFPVTWTSSDGSFKGIEVMRLTADGLVAEEYRIGASSASTTATPGAADLVDRLLAAQNGSDGSAASALFASGAGGSVIHDQSLVNTVPDKAHFVNAINNGNACCETRTGNASAEGPFVLFPFLATSSSGAAVGQGFTILELNGDGQIQYVWEIGAAVSQPSPAPSAAPSAAGTAR